MPAYPSGYAPAPPPHGQGAPQAQLVQQMPPQQQQQQQQPPVQTTSAPAPTESNSSGDVMSLPNPGNLPGTSEDYAKALQEAYRKGAEAAARMAQQQQLPTAASCPNFQTGPHVAPAPPMGSSPPPPARTGTAYQQHPVHLPPSAIPDPLSSSMPPPPPAHHAPAAAAAAPQYSAPPPPQQQQPQMVTYVHPPPAGQPHHQQYQQLPPPHTVAHATPQQQHPGAVPPQPQIVTSAPPVRHAPQAAPPVKPPPGRSMSMPDMSAYAAKAEEEKRQKRLARNRASARLRRLRKKNLVSATFFRKLERVCYNSHSSVQVESFGSFFQF